MTMPIRSDIQTTTLQAIYGDRIPAINKRYFEGSIKSQIYALDNGKFWVFKVSTGGGILCDTWLVAKGYRDMFCQRYDSVERMLG